MCEACADHAAEESGFAGDRLGIRCSPGVISTRLACESETLWLCGWRCWCFFFRSLRWLCLSLHLRLYLLLALLEFSGLRL
jgi:hypothetical protein